ncbi:hypothetical protein HMPREF9072_01093 [Capnocytophaga sp. oral taxon 324 str. F0483]|nr:hypothetical protein HMPREF9072_01093 [Capnocytophaga sp. oral taxon 324 str. F0483]
MFVFSLSARRATTACAARTCLSCYDLALSLIWYYWHFWYY